MRSVLRRLRLASTDWTIALRWAPRAAIAGCGRAVRLYFEAMTKSSRSAATNVPIATSD